jgi:hypothetical protein
MLNVAGICKRLEIRYTRNVADTTVTGRGTPNNRSARPRKAAFLCVPPSCASFNGRALAGTASAVPVSSVAGVPTLSMCPLTPFGTGARVLTANRRGRTMCDIPARPEQAQFSIEFIHDALRAAAVESTPNGAIDTLADAFTRVAAIARAEVSHG